MVIVPPQPARSQSGISGSPSPDLYVCPFTILESSAEQAPWDFSNIIMGGFHWIIKRKRQYMKTADYSIEGMEDHILIERKSPSDLVGSVCAGHRRLANEHQRMLEVVQSGGFCCLICEGSFSEIDDELQTDGRYAAAETLMGCTSRWPRVYRVPWYFAGDRRRAELLAWRVLWKWWQESGGEGENKDGKSGE